MINLRIRMPSLWSILTLLAGKDAKAEERKQAEAIRAEALAELQEAMRRRDTRRAHKAHRDAVAATCEALKVGA